MGSDVIPLFGGPLGTWTAENSQTAPQFGAALFGWLICARM